MLNMLLVVLITLTFCFGYALLPKTGRPREPKQIAPWDFRELCEPELPFIE